MQAQQYRMPPEEFVRRIQEAGQLGAIYSDVRRSKALLTAVRAAAVTDASGSVVDMSDLLGDDEPQVLEVPAPEDGAGDDASEGAEGATGGAAEEKAETADKAEEKADDKASAGS
jgi:trigger factor